MNHIIGLPKDINCFSNYVFQIDRMGIPHWTIRLGSKITKVLDLHVQPLISLLHYPKI